MKKASGIMLFYIKSDGTLFLQIERNKIFQNMYFGNRFKIFYHGSLVKGTLIEYTKTGIILDDWSIS